MEQRSKKSQVSKQIITCLEDSVPQNYTEAKEMLIDVAHELNIWTAKTLTPLLNEHLKTIPLQTPNQKVDLTYWLADDLRKLNLCLAFPGSAEPSRLVVDARYPANSGRFYFDTLRISGHRARLGVNEDHLKLSLMARPPTEPALKKYWSERLESERGDGTKQRKK